MEGKPYRGKRKRQHIIGLTLSSRRGRITYWRRCNRTRKEWPEAVANPQTWWSTNDWKWV